MKTKLIILSLAFCSALTLSCGSKKKKTSSPGSPSGDATLSVPGPRGPQGPQGEQGPAGTLDPFTFAVFDGANHSIGKTTWEQSSQFNDGQSFSFLMSDGAIFTVDPYTGFFDGGSYCFYNSTDCSGTCMFPAGPGAKEKIVQGTNGFYRMLTSQGRSQRTYNSYTIANGNGGTTCSTLPNPGTEWLVDVTTAWSFPAGITYPLQLPLDVR